MLLWIPFLSLFLTFNKRVIATEDSTAGGSGYYDTKISPTIVASVPFAGGYISVWEHLSADGRFYAQPLGIFKNSSATVRSNALTGSNEMIFGIIMWSEEAHEAVHEYLKTYVNSTAQKSKIQILPLPTEEVRVTWKSRTALPSNYRLIDQWQTNTHRPNLLQFLFKCTTLDDCETLAQNMNANPSHFDGLELEYVIQARSAARKTVTVRTEHVTSGRLFTQLQNSVEADVAYLTSHDVKKVAQESTSKVFATVIKDEEYVEGADEMKVRDVILDTLLQHEVSSAAFDNHKWDSVFWDEDVGRPDRVTRELNELLTVNESDSRQFQVTETARARANSGSGAVSIPGMGSVGGGGSNSRSSLDKLQKENFLHNLEKVHKNVGWDGEKFQVKPMKLYRQNLSELKRSTEFATTSLQVKKYEAVPSIRVRYDVVNSQTSGLTHGLVQTRLRNEVKQNIADVKKELLGNIITIEHKLQDVDVMDKTQDRLLNKLAQGLTDVKSKPGDWPPGKYCVWRNGDCPPGFSTAEMNLLLRAYYPTYSTIGSSEFKLKPPPWEYPSLELRACCKNS